MPDHKFQLHPLGPAIIPLLMKEVKRGDFFFNVPLERITGIQIAPAGKGINEGEKSKLWLKWWEGN